jgi:tetratricopeptide (TPR) repeat protein
MKKIISLAFIFLPCFSLPAFSQAKDNAELQKMYDEDQRSRQVSKIDWAVLGKQDSLREARVYALIKEGKIITGKDYYNSAMIFQHGRDSVASGMAVKQMRKAIELDTTLNKWLLAAAIDRDLMRRNKPQVYGTQYVKAGENAKWERYKIDSTQVTDAERKFYGVESLAEQKIKERNLNLLPVSEYFTTSNSIDETINFIQSEIKKGTLSGYNVTEAGINSFGYELMNGGKKEEALKIFRLNTELYPNGYNTWDSYGECLLLLNRKSEGLKAYERSLELNPKNETARKILNENK